MAENVLGALARFLRANGWMLSYALLAFVTLLSLIPLPEFSQGSNDKLGHLMAYAAIVFPAVIAGARKWHGFAALVIAWSGVIELAQPYVGRQAEWLDLLSNSVGVLIGVFLALIVQAIFRAIEFKT